MSVAAVDSLRPQNPGLAKVEKDVAELKGKVNNLETKAEKASRDSDEIKGKLETILTKVQSPGRLETNYQANGYQGNPYQSEGFRSSGYRGKPPQNRNVPTNRSQFGGNRYQSVQREGYSNRPSTGQMNGRQGSESPPDRA